MKPDWTKIGKSFEEPEGQYVCPNCEGEGRIYRYKHGCPGIVYNPHVRLYDRCFVCGGKGMVKKCKTCDEALPIHDKLDQCSECVFKEAMAEYRRDKHSKQS